MITINNLSKSYGTRVLFDNLSFSVGKGEKIGLVGRNGYGKTTLLKMITGEAEYDSGEIQIPKNYKIGYLKQHLDFKYKTISKKLHRYYLKKKQTINGKPKKFCLVWDLQKKI